MQKKNLKKNNNFLNLEYIILKNKNLIIINYIYLNYLNYEIFE
jgi:hypothetical protein